MARRGRNMLIFLLSTSACLALAACVVLKQAQFGAYPEGDRLARIQASPHYADGVFANLTPTPMLAQGQSTFKIIAKGLLSRVVHVVPARHYSGRGFSRNRTLWAGFVLETPRRRLFLSGDTGYGPHFADLGRAFGGVDLVALDGGQYDARWPRIHMTPEEAVRAAQDLGARSLLLAHAGRFSIAAHAWDEPFKRVVAAGKGKDFQLVTPKIGEPVRLDGREQHFPPWWQGVDAAT